MRLSPLHATALCALALAAACAGAPARPEADPRQAELADLTAQLKAQSALVADQQRRIEQLELRLASLSSKLGDTEKKRAASAAALVAPARTAADAGDTVEQKPAEAAPNPTIEFDGSSRRLKPAKADPRDKLQTVTLEPGAPAKGRRLRRNPVDRAPRLSTATDLKEPADSVLRELAERAEPRQARASGVTSTADFSFAHAVQRLNDGDRPGAQAELLAFARRYPQHAAADNAIYLAGVAQVHGGDCETALSLFGRVEAEYPAGDAVPAARLEAARCLLKLGRKPEAKELLGSLEKDHPDVPEATQARALLNGL